ncbi:MAG: PAS domain S-box protein [Methanosarcinales archaeon]|nr:MAG: PAS domain S-box protein [Methanosarcinales archaeon]
MKGVGRVSERGMKRCKIVAMMLLLACCCMTTYYFHVVLGIGAVFSHLFYIPIILAALWWRKKGLFVAIFLAALLVLSHLFMRHDVTTVYDYIRAPVLIIVSITIIVLTDRVIHAEHQAHLSGIFKTIKNVNHLVVTTKDRSSLLNKVCDAVIEEQRYCASCIACFGGDSFTAVSSSCASDADGISRFCDSMSNSNPPKCVKDVLATEEQPDQDNHENLIKAMNKTADCRGCPFEDTCAGSNVAVTRIEHAGKQFGLFAIIFLPGVKVRKGEKELLKEVASSIAIALDNMALEEMRKQSDAALQESEALYRAIFENTVDGIAIYDAVDDGADFIFADINKGSETIDNIKREEVISRSILGVFPGVEEFGLLEVFRRVWATGMPEHHPISMYQDNRIAGWREHFVYKLPSGEIASVYHDETNRRIAEESLKRSERQLRETKEYLTNVIESSADAVVVVDMDGIVRDWNAGAEGYMGYTADEVLGTHNRRFFANPAEADRIIEMVNRDGKIRHYRTIATRKGGTPVQISMSVAMLKDKDGVPIGTVRVSRDITETMEFEAKIRKERDNLNLMFDAMADWVYVVSDNYKIEFMNKALVNIFGDRAGSTCYGVFHNREEPCPLCKNPRVLRGETVRWEWHANRRDRTYDLIETPFKNIDGTISKLTMFRDITRRKQAEKRIKEEYHRAEFYTDIMGHDINNMNQVTIGYLDLMLQMPDFPDQFKEHIRTALKHAKKSANLIANVKKLSRVRSGEIELHTIDIYPAFTSAVEDAKSVQGKVRVNSNITDGQYFIRGNDLLFDVFANLLNNAVKFDEHEIIEIDVNIDSPASTPANREYWQIEVMDHGHGISDKYKEVIFNRLEQAGESSQGSGLGLTIVKNIVESYGGTVQVEDRIRGNWTHGSKFVINLPKGKNDDNNTHSGR